MRFSQRYRFADWPNSDIPSVAAGVYAIWNGRQLIYCGMSGRGMEQAFSPKRKCFGLMPRLASHAKGRLSGDQFCVYLANRLVLPGLRVTDLPKFASGELSLDKLTQEYIRKHLEYQFCVVESSSEARALEKRARSGELFGQVPFLNPL